uniref:Uncharacterized protein n=1 Tax=Nelumbo nucifera TaxID=4432 RepID=A0A822Y8R4_NELNU|nr:TPA_asm: hypothetical protein HUJ06_029429 [Nelumbo nucifera]
MMKSVRKWCVNDFGMLQLEEERRERREKWEKNGEREGDRRRKLAAVAAVRREGEESEQCLFE